MSDAVIITIITGVVGLIGIGLTGFVNIRLGKIHKQLNSRMDELLAAAKLAGNLEGRKELKQEQKKEK